MVLGMMSHYSVPLYCPLFNVPKGQWACTFSLRGNGSIVALNTLTEGLASIYSRKCAQCTPMVLPSVNNMSAVESVLHLGH